MQTLLSAIRSARTPLGAATAQTLQALLNKPEQCLPHPSPLFSGAYVQHQRSFPHHPSHSGNPSFFDTTGEGGGAGAGTPYGNGQMAGSLKRKISATIDRIDPPSSKARANYFSAVADMNQLFAVASPVDETTQRSSATGPSGSGGLSPGLTAALGPEYARYLDQAEFGSSAAMGDAGSGSIGGEQRGMGSAWESVMGGDRAALRSIWEQV